VEFDAVSRFALTRPAVAASRVQVNVAAPSIKVIRLGWANGSLLRLNHEVVTRTPVVALSAIGHYPGQAAMSCTVEPCKLGAGIVPGACPA
jgi:hypothetical protein